MNLPPNTNIVKPENKCDICKKEYAKYYNTTFYIHFCSIKCFNQFINGYNKEIEEISTKLLEPDNITKSEKNNDL